ncbi:tubby C-terminal-like domain-containing protein [Pavlovales sp. CCMP2436]|nr:tubby C-terminal-like domain-containing protein [Pavlovales sp. CCMP2436]|mmetsp:Transcript_42861/g.99336  ORF Transcript_42861/g.99336 Transcript_42861/m.99336 type:complete len:270 (+) Transcript_42861:3-812(+)
MAKVNYLLALLVSLVGAATCTSPAMRMQLVGVSCACTLGAATCTSPAMRQGRMRPGHARVAMNLFADLFDGKLEAMTPVAKPLYAPLVLASAVVYQLQEKALFSLSGEDFRVRDASGQEVLSIAGFNVNLGVLVIDKLGMRDPSGNQFASIERRIVAASTSYDIYHDEKLLGKIERKLFSFTPEYSFYYDADANANGRAGTLTAAGSFTERRYTVKNGDGKTVARVDRAIMTGFAVADQYQVVVSAGVDAAAVIALALVIDEDHDEGND